MRVPYATILCSECGKEISFDTDENKYLCENSHEMAEAQFQALYDSPSQAQAQVKEEAKIKDPPAGVGQMKPAKTVYTDPQPLQDVLRQAKDNVEAQAAEEPVAHTMPDVRIPDILNVDKIISSLLRDVELTVPGGDVVIPIRLPEHYVQCIKEYAESQKLTMQEYMNQRILFACESGWIV